MRGALCSIAITLIASTTLAFDIEQQQLFQGQGDETISILSTTDIGIFRPVIEAFQEVRPDIGVDYVVASTQEVYRAIYEEGAVFDLAVSSAMDLQMKLANDGLAQGHSSAQTEALPDWARWQDQLFAFAQEPVVTVVSQAAFEGRQTPATRSDLIRQLRDDPETFRGRIGTYDPRKSGAGYLFATQDARQSDTYWRLSEVMGGLEPKLYEASSAMLNAVESGELAIAYNVLGSYALARLDQKGAATIIELEDFTNILLRTALIPANAENPSGGAAFLDFLLSATGQRVLEENSGLPRINAGALAAQSYLRPIRLDTGLLVFVDPLKRQQFLREWSAAVVQ
ncbi:ABC transporter substrate-binding protein [Marivivens sp. LCG002]|uniref:ABC transporter substrate-binding protein n=1 Tax=Marivivens sp. LCG002 TaxID=3051171 RepID=UPI0025542414|nr:ABC transporter substrate-binding protein [Marivivens sp. LCG002]WIV51597.1 ABC transporter substrate-binding protein [Marivivens sp. LCG002]